MEFLVSYYYIVNYINIFFNNMKYFLFLGKNAFASLQKYLCFYFYTPFGKYGL